jgi:hypothetical protein
MADRERSRSPDGGSPAQNGAGTGGGGSPPPENAGGGGDYNGGGGGGSGDAADGVKLYVGNLDYGAFRFVSLWWGGAFGFLLASNGSVNGN